MLITSFSIQTNNLADNLKTVLKNTGKNNVSQTGWIIIVSYWRIVLDKEHTENEPRGDSKFRNLLSQRFLVIVFGYYYFFFFYKAIIKNTSCQGTIIILAIRRYQ